MDNGLFGQLIQDSIQPSVGFNFETESNFQRNGAVDTSIRTGGQDSVSSLINAIRQSDERQALTNASMFPENVAESGVLNGDNENPPSPSQSFEQMFNLSKTARTPEQSAAPEQTESGFHTIQEGDSLETIAQRFGVDPAEIVRANQLNPDDELFIDEEIIIPNQI